MTASFIGFVWAAGSIMAMNTHYPNIELPVALIASGLAFGGIIYHINFRCAFHSYFWALMGPISLYIIFFKGNYFAGFTIITTGFVYLFFYAGNLHKRSLHWLEEDVERAKLINELSLANKRIQRLSETDALTGLKNRTFFNTYITKVWKQAVLKDQQISVVLLDIDYFKLYNDNYGHIAGDEALKKVAQVLKSVTPPTPTTILSRVGGEEFIAILPSCDQLIAANYADELRCAVEDAKIPHQYSQCNDFLTISLGVAGETAKTNSKSIHLIDCADQAL
ncbi:MAG: GGDEF domain-containing protein, partial [Vibrio cyclitrophicus]